MAFDSIQNDRPIVTRKEAMAAGLRRYFTGEPCKFGHVDERQARNGECMECARVRSLSRYHSDPSINVAAVARQGQRYKDDPSFREMKKASSRSWTAENKERAATRKKEYHLKNRENANRQCRERWAENKKNPDWLARERKRKREEMRAHPERRAASYATRRRRLKEIDGKFTAKDITEILKSQGFRCVYCRTDLRRGHEIDHVMPVAKGGSDWPINLQCLCSPCNRSKSAKLPDVYEKEIGWRC